MEGISRMITVQAPPGKKMQESIRKIKQNVKKEGEKKKRVKSYTDLYACV
jgi:hypothetical protein